MVFSRFIWTILAYVALVTSTALLLGIYLQKPAYPFTISLLILALFLETAALIWYLTRIRRDLLRLITALSNDDPTMQFSSIGKDPYFRTIHQGFNELIRDFRLVRVDREAQQRFFEETVNHVQFGLIAFNSEGQVRMLNQAFLKLVGLEQLEELQELEKQAAELLTILNRMKSGKEQLHQIRIQDHLHHLIFLGSGFVLKGEEITLVSVRDISRVMDQNELEAWQKLLRVLRHEILNSISPIRLIAGNLSEQILNGDREKSLEKLSQQEIQDIRSGLETIHRRASGLSVFLDAYTQLYRTPEFHAERCPVGPLLMRLSELFKDHSSASEVSFEVRIPAYELEIHMDERMVEQVLINLLKNAMEAVQGTKIKRVSLSAFREGHDGIRVISVEDSGEGIPEDELGSIFIPFYSTKEKGSGIGLSFSQQVMQLHGGRIRVHSVQGEGSRFQLLFPPD